MPNGALREAMDRHPSAVGRCLDAYLAAVAREMRARGVITGSPQRTDPTQRLLGSIVLDCTAVRVAAWADDPSAGRQSLGGALHPERPAPVVLTWDEEMGWCAGLHHDPTSASRRYLHSGRLPTPDVVAEFVIGLALGRAMGAAHPACPHHPRGRPAGVASAAMIHAVAAPPDLRRATLASSQPGRVAIRGGRA